MSELVLLETVFGQITWEYGLCAVTKTELKLTEVFRFIKRNHRGKKDIVAIVPFRGENLVIVLVVLRK